MSSQVAINILNDLLAAESRSLLPRLGESIVFVSAASAQEQRQVERMTDAGREHLAWLIDAMRNLGGEPFPVHADIHTGDIHFLELHHVLPRVLKAEEQLLTAFESAAADLGSTALAASAVARIIERRRTHIDQLKKMTDGLQSPAA